MGLCSIKGLGLCAFHDRFPSWCVPSQADLDEQPALTDDDHSFGRLTDLSIMTTACLHKAYLHSPLHRNHDTH
jgi:hypothetical protein